MRNQKSNEFEPRRQTIGSAGYDMYAVEDMKIERWYQTFDTEVYFDGEECPVIEGSKSGSDKLYDYYPKEWVALILPRSSMGFNNGLRFANTVCVIDKDYRDTIKVRMICDIPFTIKKGERFAQMIFIPYCILLDEIEPTKERSGGIGSTN